MPKICVRQILPRHAFPEFKTNPAKSSARNLQNDVKGKNRVAEATKRELGRKTAWLELALRRSEARRLPSATVTGVASPASTAATARARSTARLVFEVHADGTQLPPPGLV